MKKGLMIRLAAALVCAVLCFSETGSVFAAEKKDKARVYKQTYLLMEPETKTVIREKNSGVPVKMGSFNKLMTVLLAAEAVQRGDISFETQLVCSENANSKQGAQIWLMPGEKMSLEDLLKAVIIGNANDAACVIAEKVGGSEGKFIEMMNTRAAELGMKNTLFTECTGFYDDESQYTTAYDAALLLCELHVHEELSEMFTTRLEELKDGAVQLVSVNRTALKYKGAMGFKCGTGPSSGYFAAEGAKRGDRTFIAAVMDCPDEDGAMALAEELLDTGFGSYEVTSLSVPEDMPGEIPVKQGSAAFVQITAEDPGRAVVGVGSSDNITAKVILPSFVYAPLRKGDKIGELRFYIGDRLLKTCVLRSAADVGEKDIKTALSEMFKYIFAF